MDNGELDSARGHVEVDEEVAVAMGGAAECRTWTHRWAGHRALRRFLIGGLVDQVNLRLQSRDVAALTTGALAYVASITKEVGAEDFQVSILVVVIDDLEDIELAATIAEPPFIGVLRVTLAARKCASTNQLAEAQAKPWRVVPVAVGSSGTWRSHSQLIGVRHGGENDDQLRITPTVVARVG